ncbi:efflux RND transporter permease subunit [Chromatiaceae bacterium AAb-1]|nr:efflux RND transporter permease subunit [Chromatiaceae bacterium AAb-1]
MKSRNIYAWCMNHPIGTVLLTFALVMLGILAFPRLSVAPLPEADFPTIQISARLPGASAETMASSVATPLEVALSSVPGITEMTSTSALGSVSITLQFTLEKDIDAAAQEVQAAINTAAGRLPDMPNLPTWRKVNPADSPVLIVGVTSATLSRIEVSDLAETVLARQVSQIDGVGEVFIGGQQKPAIRIQVKPEVLSATGLTLADIRESLQKASVNLPKGALFGSDRVSTLSVNDQLFTTDEYNNLIVSYRNGIPVYLRDVATVKLGAENDFVQTWPNGESGVALIIRRQPGANIVATADRIREALPQLAAALPADIKVEVFNDRTRTIRASLHEVELTLAIAVVLVIGVMAFFLKQWSATLIVATVLGVSLIATCAFMYIAGFSLNNLTLVAIVIAVGFIVDDAIVVIENIHRHLEAGESKRVAALKGAEEIGFTVISISVSLVAAFIPLLFMGGIIGRLFLEFSLTATAAILISVVVCLTLAPTLASLFMDKAPKHDPDNPDFFERMVKHYDNILSWALDHPRTMLVVFFLTIAGSIGSFIMIPKGFFPLQDTGFVIGSTQASSDISYDDMVKKHLQMAEILQKDPDITGFNHAVGGGNSIGSGQVWIVLSDPDARSATASDIINRLRPQFANIPGVQVFLRAAQDINLGSGPSRAHYQYVLKALNSNELAHWTDALTAQLRQNPMFTDLSNDLQWDANIIRLELDRQEAARLGFSAADLDQALYDAFGQRQINEYQTETNQYKVILEISPSQRGTTESLNYFQMRSPVTGQMVPLLSFAKVLPATSGPVVIAHHGLQPAANISFNLADKVALGNAVQALEQARADLNMPASVIGLFQGAAQAFQESLATQPLLIFTALLSVYIILGVLYESFVHPLTILSTLPSAAIGAILLLWLWQLDFSIMALIGITKFC